MKVLHSRGRLNRRVGHLPRTGTFRMNLLPTVRQSVPAPRLVATGGPRTGSVHLVGICGAGMKALAELLVGEGWRVTGSDLQPPSPAILAMERRGMRVHRGHDTNHLPENVDLLVYSPAVGLDNPERQSAAALGIRQLSYSQMLGALMRGRTGVCVAGTHGKSTTTAMTACVLRDARLAPSAIFGAELCGSGQSGWAGGGELFVAESCEYKRSFLDLAPTYAAILNVEPDHFDCYAEFRETQQAFADFASLVPADGVLVVRGDSESARPAVRAARSRVVTFSDQPGSDWWATDIRPTLLGTRFRVFFHGEYYSEISLRLTGSHNVQNALAAAALAHEAGVSPADIREGLADFPGVRRRFESLGSWRGIALYDDYAHHPTAVEATLNAARQKFGKRRIWCLFQPHQVSRLRTLMDDFAHSFGAATEVLVAPVYAAREAAGGEPEAASAELARRIAANGVSARYCPGLDPIRATVEDEARPGDMLITMGAGDINRVQHEFARQLCRHRPAG